MDQQQETTINWPELFATRFPILSLINGLLGLVSCCFPSLQFFFGASAVLLAILSRQGKPFRGAAVVGLVLGLIAAVSGLAMYTMYMMSIDMMNDPAYVELTKELMHHYEAIFDSLMPQ